MENLVFMKRDTHPGRPESESLFDVLIHLHVLHAASKEPVAAQQFAEILALRGYKVNNHSISTLLRRFERRGWLRAQKMGKTAPLRFRTTPAGKRALKDATPFLKAIIKEMSLGNDHKTSRKG